MKLLFFSFQFNCLVNLYVFIENYLRKNRKQLRNERMALHP